MDEDVIIPCLFCALAGWIIGIVIGSCCLDTTELDNGCIVYDNNIYCVEEVK